MLPTVRWPPWPQLGAILDGKEPQQFTRLVQGIQAAATHIGGVPFFLRTGHGSGKHAWRRTCYVADASKVASHVAALIEWSEMDVFGDLEYGVWAVRELLPTRPICTLDAYEGMPLCREFRCFVRDDSVLCMHPYWPWVSVVRGFPYAPHSGEPDWNTELERAVPDGMKDRWMELCTMGLDEKRAIEAIAARAGKALGGSWSVDILDTARGWFVTDMAEAARSWHWPGCPNAVKGAAG